MVFGIIKNVLIVLFILAVISGFVMISSDKYDISTGKGRIDFAKSYFGWIGNTAKNIYSVTAYVVKLEWIPKA